MTLKANDFYSRWEYLFKAVFIFLCFSLFFTWALNQPFDVCPDEVMRFEIPKFIFNNGALPNANDTSIIDPRYGFSYASNPMLPYIISAGFMKVVSMFLSGDFALLMAARLASMFAGVVYIIFVMKLSKLAFKKTSAQWIFIVLCSLWPQVDFVFTYVNCDGIAMMAVAIIIYFWFHAFKNGWNVKNCFGLSIGLSIGILSYLNVYMFAVLSLALFIFYFIFVDKSDKKFKSFFKYGFLILGLVLLFTGWHFIRNAILYNGNIFARGVNNFGELYGSAEMRPSVRSAQAHAILSTLSGNIDWVVKTSVSFIGRFGYMTILLDLWVYALYALEIFVALIGLIVLVVKKKFRIFNRKYLLQIFMALSIIVPFACAYIFSLSDYQPQGRYALPALIPLCYFLTLGISKICSKVEKKFKFPVWVVIPVLNGIAAIACLLLIFRAY